MADETAKLPHQNNLHIVTDPYEELLIDHDLIWIQQNCLPPSLIDALEHGVTAHIIWNHMSGAVHEELPMFADIEQRLADSILANAPEIRDIIVPFGLPSRKINIFPNPAPDYFYKDVLTKASSECAAILVVSNHPPTEIVELAQALHDKNVQVDYVGDTAQIARITPNYLQRYDAVISIGKTVQYALLSGVPVYEYDHFGGAGYITPANIEQEAYYNFSGRATRQVKTVDTIAAEIIDGYKSAVDNRAVLQDLGKEAYLLSTILSRTISTLPRRAKTKRITRAEARRLATYTELYRGMYRTLMYYKDNSHI